MQKKPGKSWLLLFPLTVRERIGSILGKKITLCPYGMSFGRMPYSRTLDSSVTSASPEARASVVTCSLYVSMAMEFADLNVLFLSVIIVVSTRSMGPSFSDSQPMNMWEGILMSRTLKPAASSIDANRNESSLQTPCFVRRTSMG